ERRRHLHRLHDAWLPGQVHAVHGATLGRRRLAARRRDQDVTRVHRTPDVPTRDPDRRTSMTGARQAAERVEELLAQLRGSPDPTAGPIAEELVGCLVRLYGAGLARIVAMLGREGGRDLCADPLVESLLLVHDLHPLDADSRIRRAVDRMGVRLPQ